jgi:hypothetical protein
MTPNALAPSRTLFAIGAAIGALLLGLASPASAADEPTPTYTPTAADLTAICAQAQTYIDDGDFTKALDLIDSVRKPAREVLGPLATNAPVVNAALACDAERTLAVLGLADETPKPETTIEEFGATWDAAVKNWLVPLQGSGVALLGLWAGILVLARLLVFVPRPLWGKWSRALSRVSLFSGFVAAIFFPIELVLLVNHLGSPTSPDKDLLATIAVAVAGCVFASVTLALFLGGSNRMTVTSSDDKATSALQAGIIARLGALGPSGTRNLEVPRGTGIPADAVKNLLPALANNVFVTGLQAAMRALLGVAPWHVDYRTIDAERSVVTITRNGNGFASATIDVSKLKLPEKHDDAANFPLRLAAAVVLATMAKTHRDFEAVAGATDWRSIGLTDIATTSFLDDDPLAMQALGRALDYDPANVRAAIALKNIQYRKSANEAELHDYRVWLEGRVDYLGRTGENLVGYVDLRRQVLVAYLAVARNLIAKIETQAPAAAPPSRLVRFLSAIGATPPDGPPATPPDLRPPNSHLIARAAELVEIVDVFSPVSAGFRDRVRPVVATSVALIREEFAATAASPELDRIYARSRPWLEAARVSASPQAAYAYACYLVRGPLALTLTVVDADGVHLHPVIAERLATAFLDPDTRTWAKEDPELLALRALVPFEKLVGKSEPSTDFWSLKPFGDLKEKLAAVGVARPAALVRIRKEPGLAKALGISRPALSNVVRLSRFAASTDARSDGVGKYRVPIVEALVDLGVGEPAELTRAWFSAHGDDIASIRDSLTKKYGDFPPGNALHDWLASL